MSEFAKKLVLQLISPECYEKYFYEMDFFDGNCFKALLSKGLGFAIIAGSLGVKIPQIVKIWNAKSAAGLNLFSIFLDLLAITINMSYSFVKGFPFSAWGDVSFLGLQTAVIACLVLTYSSGAHKAGMFAIVYSAICYVLMGGITPVDFLWSMQALNIPVLVVGKLSQAWTNFQNGSTGQLSVITCFMLLFGSLARIFTSIQETGDAMMVLTYCFSAASNAVIAAQCIYYWNVEQPKPKSKPKTAKSKKIN